MKTQFFVIAFCILLLICVLLPSAGYAKDQDLINVESPKYGALFKELTAKHGFSADDLKQLFSGVAIDQRVLQLMDKQWEAKPYFKYWPLFVTPKVIATGKQKIKIHKKLLNDIENKFGVEREVIVAIWAIESKFGTYKGKFNVFKTLNTLFDRYPRRSAFFRNELIEFLLLCRENNLDPISIKGSYAGAFGQTQFISSSFRKYAVDFNNDGIHDVFTTTEDVLASIANYLQSFGWKLDAPIYHELGSELKSEQLRKTHEQGRKGRIAHSEVAASQNISLPLPDSGKLSIIGLELSPFKGGGMRYVAGYPNFHAITEWNHSNKYAMAVTELAEALGK